MVSMEPQKGGQTAEAVKYTIVSLLSSHNDSKVWLAEHNTLHVKRIIKGIRKTSPYHDSLIREAHLLQNLKNPYIPEIYDLDSDNEYTYIIEQYIPGESLKSLCNKRLLSEKEIFHFMIQFCNIINYLHTLPESLLYLDIKPENIIILNDTCYLIDFGSVLYESEEPVTVFGTPSYASPEQMAGRRLSPKADIYALGRLLEYMVSHGTVSHKTEYKLYSLISDCTERKIWGRPGSVKRLIRRIEEIKNLTGSFSKKPLKIAFAGASYNSGTTYIALLLSAFIKHLGRNCVYVENNDSEAWYSISPNTSGFRALAGLEILNRKYCENKTLPEADCIVDYGILSAKTPEDFYEADISCIIVGNRCWETDEISNTRALSRKCRKRLFLVNLSDKISEMTANSLHNDNFMCFPFIKNPDEILKNTEVKTVLYDLAVQLGIII